MNVVPAYASIAQKEHISLNIQSFFISFPFYFNIQTSIKKQKLDFVSNILIVFIIIFTLFFLS